jgi:hypothetical protein
MKLLALGCFLALVMTSFAVSESVQAEIVDYELVIEEKMMTMAAKSVTGPESGSKII